MARYIGVPAVVGAVVPYSRIVPWFIDHWLKMSLFSDLRERRYAA